ncbi:hypothetical protein BO99DRAFT_194509 [Aspergillus violaceofuscus CBS 115571]|uniref:Uncharacterized protein n=1 Tax=Aspergillus violaceofuscus (strain CBS 115571) TaxID=1450538 RepID=A0A2V5H0J6_ASPV1|nr:hypothetical protein BO99DRAFT_194509 [Aspergillus violaceofuscus CBS 115571]
MVLYLLLSTTTLSHRAVINTFDLARFSIVPQRIPHVHTCINSRLFALQQRMSPPTGARSLALNSSVTSTRASRSSMGFPNLYVFHAVQYKLLSLDIFSTSHSQNAA